MGLLDRDREDIQNVGVFLEYDLVELANEGKKRKSIRNENQYVTLAQ